MVFDFGKGEHQFSLFNLVKIFPIKAIKFPDNKLNKMFFDVWFL